MKVIEYAIMPDGTEIYLEDWSDHNTERFPSLYGLKIAAYPVAKNTGKYGMTRSGESFLLSIPQNEYAGYTNDDVKADFEELKAGTKTLEDLAEHFYNGERDKWYLGMNVEYRGW